MIVAIDGPSGSGKTTVAKEVSKRLGFSTLDTGAMYRAVTYRGLQKGFDLANIENLDEDDSVSDIRKELVRIANEEPIEFEYDNQGQPIKVTIGGQDVTREIRTPEVDRTVSVVSACSDVRKALVEQQREMGSKTDTVLEGRDIGTVVFPNADLKIFLTASSRERAHRRVLQNKDRGMEDVDEDKTLELIEFRDKFDSSRAVGPLAKADDAIEIDTTDMTFEQVVEKVTSMIEERRRG